MTSFSQGRTAEQAAAEYLVRKGYKIIAQNWRTRFCEIDIVASKQNIVYFVEVKYRKSNTHGSGFEYITPKKMNQMQYAARLWTAENKWDGDYALSALEVSGPTFEITGFIDSIE